MSAACALCSDRTLVGRFNMATQALVKTRLPSHPMVATGSFAMLCGRIPNRVQLCAYCLALLLSRNLPEIRALVKLPFSAGLA